ncbi:glutathione transferase GstA [Tianweitania sediminis]|uniref:Glutathione transferase GstA n=1 Tax=Tianweitania sediminis TaxID=1502156 RepID=A0A8J7R9S0_9HYPH|nr:glutathione transferase GstA [Tianweitania sediminis]MBP0441475.1 glutathione transferase GstA [Tianweitania sediminis]
MKLYYKPGACSLAPHIVACEANVPIGLVSVNLAEKKLDDGSDYFSISPNGYVPALDTGTGLVLTEASVVIQYIADQNPGAGLMPKAGEESRYRAQQWLAFISTEIHKSFGAFFKSGTPAETKQMSRELLAKRLSFVDKSLTGRSYLMGENFTAPDAYLFTVLSWAKHVQLDLAPYENLSRFMRSVASRPGVQQALREEGLA